MQRKKQKKDWFKERGYIHISNKISLKHKKSLEENFLSKENLIAIHKFKPLIYKEITSRRYKKREHNNKIIRSHTTIKNGEKISSKKIRPILYSSHIDANIYSYYTHKILGPKYNDLLKQDINFSNCITAYRSIKCENENRNKNNIHFAKDVFDEIKKRENCVALAFDIKSFFNNLKHDILKQVWAKMLNPNSFSLPKDHYNIFKSVTRFSYIKLDDLRIKSYGFNEKKIAFNRKIGIDSFFFNYNDFLNADIQIYKNQRKDKITKRLIGIPQGLPISALLSNLYMYDFDKTIYNNLVLKNNCFYRRYSDDIVILCKENEIKFVENFLKNEIKKIGLKIADEKTERIFFYKKGQRIYGYESSNKHKKLKFGYLGFDFDGEKTFIKSKNISSFYREMKDAINTKSKRIIQTNEKGLSSNSILFKGKIYRLYSHKGVKGRKLVYPNEKERKYKGNFVAYAYKSSKIMEAPEIKKQLRNHWKILQETIDKKIKSS